MPDDKHKSDREYNRGYRDGRSGDSYPTSSVLDIVMGALMPGVDPVGLSEDYDAGYEDGKKDNSRGK